MDRHHSQPTESLQQLRGTDQEVLREFGWWVIGAEELYGQEYQ